MENQNHEPKISILESAWRRFAQLDFRALELSHNYYRFRKLVLILGVIATLLAILTDNLSDQIPPLGALTLKFLLILTPVLSSLIAAFTNKFYTGGDWLNLRAAAEEVLKEIYVYRTIMQKSSKRRLWMERRLATIHRQVYKSLGGELILKEYQGPIPPYYSPSDPNSDPGFHDLTGEEYLKNRLQNQLDWHVNKVEQLHRDRTRLQIQILAMGGAGAILAAFGGSLTIWVAFTASIAGALSGWDGLRNLDSTIKNYSKVIVELMTVRDHWVNLEPEERVEAEFFRMVRATEKVLWNQNVEYIKTMQEALTEGQDEEGELVNSMVRMSVEADARSRKAMRDSFLEYSSERLLDASDQPAEIYNDGLFTFEGDLASEEVQKDLDDLGESINQAVTELVENVETYADKFTGIARKYAGVALNKETSKETINEVLSQYPVSGEIKG